MTQETERLPLRQILAFSSVGIAIAAIGLPFAVYMPRYYAGDLGMGLELTGLIFMALRFWDIITDPVMGYLVDRHPSRWGRVKHWLALSVPLLMIAAFFLYFPGLFYSAENPVHPLYLAGWLALFYVGFTLLQTPHQAWAPSLARSYDERSRLFQWREVFSIGALLVLLILPDLVSRFTALDRGQQIMIMGVIFMISLPLTITLALTLVPDHTKGQPRGELSDFTWPSLKAAFNNGPLWRVVIIEVCVGIAIASTAATYLFAAEWGFGVVAGAGTVLMLFFISGFCAIPFWMWLSRKTQKHTAVAVICAFAAVAYIAYFPLSNQGGFTMLMSGAILSGLAFGSPMVLVRSMMADLVERELLRSHKNRTGLFSAMMTSAYKTGASLAVGIPFVLLGSVVGFDPAGENSPEAVRGLMLTFVGVPAAAYVIAAIAAWGYPVTREEQARVSQELAELRRQKAGS